MKLQGPNLSIKWLSLKVKVTNSSIINTKIDWNGEEHVYTAIEEGDVKGCSGEKELHLKDRCPVMLIVNLSDELVNGLTGKVTKVTEKNINVFFPTLNREVNVQKFSFTKYSAKLKRDVGCRMQFPLKLAYASTIHKAQGMTLDRVSLDCKKMFQYGQLAVGLSRARLKKGLQVLNFSKLLLKPPPPVITDFLQREPLSVELDFSCCMETKNLVSGKSLPSHTCCVSNVDACSTEDFDSDIEQEIIAKVNVIEQELSKDNTEIKYPLPEDFVEKTLHNLLFQNPETEQQTLQNIALSTLQDSIVDTRNYIQYVWKKFSGLIEGAYLNSQDITNKKLSNLYKLINKELTSEENKVTVSSLFGHNPSENEFNLIYRITSTVRKEVLRLAANPIVQEVLKQAEEEKERLLIILQQV
ncbi:PIF1 [Mytilus edulis]|uniref:PIF1 n=1 Tax=Mytilus edulis TaxID=6550 RepID=A0A8S3SZX1_MYTED|nr:PIF1 [Mytilus edulis]